MPAAPAVHAAAVQVAAVHAAAPHAAAVHAPARPVRLLLNLGHALDHMFLLIFAAAVTTIAAEFKIGRWEDLMPYGTGAFLMFGLAALPAGRLGDLWGRRP